MVDLLVVVPHPDDEAFGAGSLFTHRLRLNEKILGLKIKAVAQYKTQALSLLSFMERSPERLWTETFHEIGQKGVWEGRWW
ncbi:MAG: hypothetical protein ACUVQD_05960 [Thermaceae bacterium]